MGSVQPIEGEAFEIAAELVRVSGQPIQSVVTETLRERPDPVRSMRTSVLDEAEIEERMRRARAITADICRHLEHPLPGSDHSWLDDDETGLPK